MSKQKQQPTEQTSKAPIKATAAITFIMGLLTVLAIAPDNTFLHVGYIIIVGYALFHYAVLRGKKKITREKPMSREKLEALKTKMEADEVRLEKTAKKIEKLEEKQAQVEADLARAHELTIKEWYDLCDIIEDVALNNKQSEQYKKLLNLLRTKKDEGHLHDSEADKAKKLYQTIYTQSLATMKKRYEKEKTGREEIKADIDKKLSKAKSKKSKK